MLTKEAFHWGTQRQQVLCNNFILIPPLQAPIKATLLFTISLILILFFFSISSQFLLRVCVPELGTMARNMGILICLLIMIMDVIAGILGLEAELAQNKMKHVRVWILECRKPSYKAFQLGLAAAVLLALAHAVGNLLGGCICVRSRDEFNKATPNRQLALASLFFSWIILAIGFSMLILGALSNSKSNKYCGLSHHRFFSVGGILCFIHGFFIVAYYVSASAAAKEERLARFESEHGHYPHQHGHGHGSPADTPPI